jgi:hypothetical protein
MRKHVIGAAVGAVCVLALPSIASASVLDQTVQVNASKVKQDKKVRGHVGLFRVDVDTVYGGGVLAPAANCQPADQSGCTFFPPANQTVLTFSKDFKFKTGPKLGECDLSQLIGQTNAAAKANCADAEVGFGSSVIRRIDGGTLNGVVAGFNGPRSGGNATIYLHVDIPGSTTKPILTGTLNGNVLTVTIPVTPGTVIQHFDTTIPKQVVKKTKKKNKKTGKKKTKKVYYVSARCKSGAWTHGETTTFTNGFAKTATTTQACKQKGNKN